MIDFDYKEKDGEKSVMYVMAIENFRTKLETARVGQVDSTKRFSINGSEFRIDLYIRGVDESNKDFIGLFLTNTNKKMTGVKFEVLAFKGFDNILIKTAREDLNKTTFGWVRCVPHSRCTKRDLLDTSGTLWLKVDLELSDPRIPSQDIQEQLVELQEKFASKERQFDLLRTELRSIRAELRNNNIQGGKAPPVVPSTIKCPGCRKDVRKPMRLQQCPQGHVLCDDCIHHNNNYSNRSTRNICITCKKEKYSGRPIALEKFLRLRD